MIPNPEDSRADLGPIPLDRLLTLLVAHEGSDVLEEILSVITENTSGYHELSWNVWYVDIDLDKGLVRYDHDFDPYQGSIPLPEFKAAVEARLR